MNREYQKKSYKALYMLLDAFYSATKNDYAGILLGSMNPELFNGVDSADPATFEDFCDCLNECYKKTMSEDIKTAFSASIQFLDFYKNEFGFELTDIEQYIDYKRFQLEFIAVE